MWFVFATIHCFFLALVNYIDEYLTTNNKVPKSANIHKRIGGLLLISTLMSFVGAFLVFISNTALVIPNDALLLTLLSTIPIVIMYASYFYLLTIYSPHLVVPLFQISSIWLLLFEFLIGEKTTAFGLAGIFILMFGAYLLDSGSFKWQIPSKLLVIAIPVTSTWAIALFLVRLASKYASIPAITFWQLIGIGCIGIILFAFVKDYRNGFLQRIQSQGKNFLGFSLVNETLAEAGYLFSNLAVAIAPVAAFVTAMSGVQSVFVLLLFMIFPQGERTKPTQIQIIAIILIAIGVFFIQGLS